MTNLTKFTIIALDRKKKADIRVENRAIEYNENAKMLELKIKSHGYLGHQMDKLNLNNPNLNKLYKFKNLSTKNKTEFYNCLIKPILTHLAVPFHTMSK